MGAHAGVDGTIIDGGIIDWNVVGWSVVDEAIVDGLRCHLYWCNAVRADRGGVH